MYVHFNECILKNLSFFKGRYDTLRNYSLFFKSLENLSLEIISNFLYFTFVYIK